VIVVAVAAAVLGSATSVTGCAASYESFVVHEE
jgi:hypothetical protein